VIYLRTTEAARLLDVTPNTLREWERRFGFPIAGPSRAGTREFVFDEIVALRDALQRGASIAAAVAHARAALAADNASALWAGFTSLDGARCAEVMETALRFRSLEGATEEVLVRALDAVARSHGPGSAPWGFAAEFATRWLRRTTEQAWRPIGAGSVIVGAAAHEELGLDGVYLRTLELLVRLAGYEVVTAAPDGPVDFDDAGLHHPRILLVAGAQPADAAVDRWACAAHQRLGPTGVAMYRCDPRSLPVFSPLAVVLSQNPADAQRELTGLVDHVYASPQPVQQRT
jgi:DNA-binding transcriptional MerR regulator